MEKLDSTVGIVECCMWAPSVYEWKTGWYWYSPRFWRLVYNNISTGIEHWIGSKALIFRAGKLKIKRSENIDCYVFFGSGRLGYNITRLEDLRILPFVYEWKTDIHIGVVDLIITAVED